MIMFYLISLHVSPFLAHLSRMLNGSLWYTSRAIVRVCVQASTCSNMNISETSRPIAIKSYLKHHWGGGKASLDFYLEQIRTLVSMATDSCHTIIMGKLRHHVFSNVLIGSFSYLQVTMTRMRAWMSSKFGRIRPRTTVLAALERMKKIPYTYNG